MRWVVAVGLAVLVVGSIVVSWVLAGDLYPGGGEVETVSGVERDHPLVARAIAEAGLEIPDTATDYAAQVAEVGDFSAVAFTLPATDVAAFLDGSGVPVPFDEDPTPPPPIPEIGWAATDTTALVTATDEVDGRRRLVSLDLARPEQPRVLVRTTRA